MLVGVDPHADQITVTLTDDMGTPVDTRTVPNRLPGWKAAIRWVGQSDPWMVENAHGWGYGIARFLNSSGVHVADVAPWMTQQLRRRRPQPHKTDPGDAALIALAGRVFDPPAFQTLDTIDELRSLLLCRRQLVKTRTQLTNQIKATLHRTAPELAITRQRLRSRTQFKRLCRVHTTSAASTHTVRIQARLALSITDQIHDLETRIHTQAPPVVAALMTIHGIGLIGATTIITEVRHPNRFATHAQLASWAGTAPLDNSSGRQQGHRVNPYGNRLITSVIHLAIETQAAHNGPAAHYIQRRQQQGTPRRAAKRVCARHLTRTIHHILTRHPWTHP